MIDAIFKFILVMIAVFGTWAVVGSLMDIKTNHGVLFSKLDDIEERLKELEGKNEHTQR